jgi:RimJ/RimL family protein N-acetyltransferase
MKYKVKIVPFSRDFLVLSFNWLNDIEIKCLTNTPSFTIEDQLRWYNGLVDKNNYHIWGIEIEHKKIGACGLKNITETDCEYWGYIGEKELWGNGIGTQMLHEMENRAKGLGLKSIWLKVIQNNQRAINLYKSMGYKQTDLKDKLILMQKVL